MSIKFLKQLALASTLALASISAQAATYHYENTPAPAKKMDSYSTTWDEATEMLSISSTWSGVALSRIEFLISDGPSPWNSGNHGDDVHNHTSEQFLFYSVDLAAETATVQTYKGGRVDITVFDNTQGVSVTGTSIDLNLDHTVLNDMTVADLNIVNGASYSSYRGAGFKNKIGIWYYMYDMSGNKIETLDIHDGNTTVVPVPAALFLFAPALLGLLGFRRKVIA